ncbi:hypothetical protein LINPERPRIM_LOCUS16874 [Linum perenne]
MWWRRAGLSFGRNVVHSRRRFCTATRRQIEDEGDWYYSSEWWGTDSDGYSIMRTDSSHGNGIVSVLAYPSSKPYVDLKSMVASGLTAIASCGFDLAGVAYGKKKMRILCIGHGGGSLPLFLASKLQGLRMFVYFNQF